MTTTESSEDLACRNCGAPLAGAWCHACGQKRVTDRERGLGYLLGEAFRKLTDLDGTLLRSLRLLLLSPGVLSRDWLDDKRARHAAPITLFLLANVLYFFAPALTDFNLPFADQVPGEMALRSLDPANDLSPEHRAGLARSLGQKHSRWTAPLVERKLAARVAADPRADLRAIARDYDNEAGIVGKVLMIVHVPIIALALALVYVRQRRYFASHFVVALHLFTFLLLFVQLVVTPMHWLPEGAGAALPPWFSAVLAVLLFGALCAYFLLACRNAYRVGWLGAASGLVAVLAGLWFANLWVYRTAQFLVTMALID